MTNDKLNQAATPIKLIAVACLLTLSACGSSSGTMVGTRQLAEFTPGKTSYDDVTARLGTPSTVKTSSDGTRTASYTHASVRARPESFIPLVGGFVGGADSTAHTVSLTFDKKNVLTGIDTQDSSFGSDSL